MILCQFRHDEDLPDFKLWKISEEFSSSSEEEYTLRHKFYKDGGPYYDASEIFESIFWCPVDQDPKQFFSEKSGRPWMLLPGKSSVIEVIKPTNQTRDSYCNEGRRAPMETYFVDLQIAAEYLPS